MMTLDTWNNIPKYIAEVDDNYDGSFSISLYPNPKFKDNSGMYVPINMEESSDEAFEFFLKDTTFKDVSFEYMGETFIVCDIRDFNIFLESLRGIGHPIWLDNLHGFYPFKEQGMYFGDVEDDVSDERVDSYLNKENIEKLSKIVNDIYQNILKRE